LTIPPSQKQETFL